jgi:hypothetical protein
MAETTTRSDWLRAEIELARDYIERHRADVGDPVALAQLARRERELIELHRELDKLESPTRELTFRLKSGQIEGHNAPVGLVRTIVQRIGEITDEFGVHALVAPALPGSHVITFVGPAQGELAISVDPFADAALALMALSPERTDGQPFEEYVREHAAEYTPKTLVAAREIMDSLSRHGVDATLDLVSLGTSSHAGIPRAVAQDVGRILADVESETREVEVTGRLSGFMEGRPTTFRIEADRDYRGTVPAPLRSAADGIPHGSTVHAVLDEIASRLPSGDTRVRYRLKSIQQIS